MVVMKRTNGGNNMHLDRIDRETMQLSAKLGLTAHLPVLCGSDHVTDPHPCSCDFAQAGNGMRKWSMVSFSTQVLIIVEVNLPCITTKMDLRASTRQDEKKKSHSLRKSSRHSSSLSLVIILPRTQLAYALDMEVWKCRELWDCVQRGSIEDRTQ
ncbi:hypothetical protein BO86DRAFT_210173 [Aspergillus japonicus CBS 114.51]|uniref:Uncharacterized protein n=1 Tax=Aspergillus japonicus CBS 114.51 TaxID=1448312 RepID=A0A8T8X9S4_ASPJA|nr:hypothetical protein BO86DRAFT_210173 [Aspergillus japonicus CBS 114.51]RAH84927.1 hypothetical protein BO86DRAFT_210173 [Aspergillus japonicus CBS 114.51]